jgi:hypothetical protein
VNAGLLFTDRVGITIADNDDNTDDATYDPNDEDSTNADNDDGSIAGVNDDHISDNETNENNKTNETNVNDKNNDETGHGTNVTANELGLGIDNTGHKIPTHHSNDDEHIPITVDEEDEQDHDNATRQGTIRQSANV